MHWIPSLGRRFPQSAGAAAQPRALPTRRGGTISAENRTMTDLVWAARSLRRSPRFALLVIGMLALGIGATTAVFAAVDAVLLRSLPFREPERLASVFGTNPSLEGGRSVLSAADFEVLQASGAFDSIAVTFTPAQGLGVKIGAEPEVVRGTWMSAELLDTLGVKPLLGRGPGAEDARPQAEKTAVLG